MLHFLKKCQCACIVQLYSVENLKPTHEYEMVEAIKIISDNKSPSFVNVLDRLLVLLVPLQPRSTCRLASLASTGKSYSGLCSTDLDFVDFTARYYIF